MGFEVLGSEGGPRSIGRRVEAAERAKLIIKLLNAGNTVNEISQRVGVSTFTVREAIKKAIYDHPVEDVEGWRAVELTRLENLHRQVAEKIAAMLEKADDPEALDLRSVDRLLKIAERRAKLLGLDMPVRMEIEPGATTRIIEVSAWPTDHSGQAIAAPNPSVDKPEEDRGAGGGDGIGEDVVRPDLAAQETH